METLQERKRLNEEIERTFIAVAIYARNIQTFKQTERGATLINLYELFFADFALLVMLTSDLAQMLKDPEAVKKAVDWLKIHGVANMNDRQLEIRCNEGVGVFMDYKRALSKQGVISLPVR